MGHIESNKKFEVIRADIPSGKISVMLYKEFFEKEAVLKTCLKFEDRCFTQVYPSDEYNVCINLTKKEGIDEDLIDLALLFCNEVSDQQIRQDLLRENSAIRDCIYERAFSLIKGNEDA